MQQPFGVPPRRRRSGNLKPFLILLGVVSTCGCFTCVFGSVLVYRDQQAFGALDAACHGQAVAGAPAYTAGHGHRTVVIDEAAGNDLAMPELVPDGNRASSVADTEVVLCLGDAVTQTIETCTYQDTVVGVGVPGSESTKTRTQSVKPIRAIAAATGQPIAQGTVSGPPPHDCDTTFGHAPSDSDLAGGDPGAPEIGAWFLANVP